MILEPRIKILVIINAVFGYDGISSVATNYYRYQDKTRVKMDLLTINPVNKKLASEIRADGNKNYILPGRNSNPIKYILRLKKIVTENNYDIVYVHGNSATMAVELFAAQLGGCTVRVAHSHNTQCNHQVINKMLMPLFSRLYTDCCACSVEAGSFLFGDKKCHLVNNGLFLPSYEFSDETRRKVRNKYGINCQFVIGHIGRFVYQKNHEFLIKLLKTLINKGEDAVLLLVGEGELVERTKELAKEANLEKRVIFFGVTDCVNEVVQAMDCFVFPSRFEGLGMVAIEAQASGLPCVASDQVPHTIKVNENTVFLSLKDDIEKWADVVIARKTTPCERNENKRRTEYQLEKAGYDIRKNCADMLIFYRNILK